MKAEDFMLADREAMATIAVRDLAAARKFYEGMLGFTQLRAEGSEAIVYRSGGSTFVVYRSQFAGTNRATAVTWNVGDEIEAVIATLKQAGIAFQHYDMPGLSRRGDVHIAGTMKAAWFKDPDGNILALTGG